MKSIQIYLLKSMVVFQEATAPLVVSAGADVLVAGNAVFGRSDRAAAILEIREAAEAALR